MEVRLRKMRTSDIPTISEIERESFPAPWSEEAFYHELIHNRLAYYIVAEVGGVVVGYAGMWLIIGEAHVTNVAVRPAYRGRKIGERLLRELQCVALQKGAVRMTLEVRVSNRIAQNLYQKLGFVASGVRPGYYVDNGEDAVVMWADLRKKRPHGEKGVSDGEGGGKNDGEPDGDSRGRPVPDSCSGNQL